MTQPKDFCLFAAWITVEYSLYAPAQLLFDLFFGCVAADAVRLIEAVHAKCVRIEPSTPGLYTHGPSRKYSDSIVALSLLPAHSASLAHALAHSKISAVNVVGARLLSPAPVFCVSVVYYG